MNQNEFIKQAGIYQSLKLDINSYQKKHKFLSNVFPNLINIIVIFLSVLFAFVGSYQLIFFIFLSYFLFLILKDTLLDSYLKKTFQLLMDNEKKYSFLTKSVMDFKHVFEENELKFIQIQIAIIKNNKKFSWKQANNYLKILKLINSK